MGVIKGPCCWKQVVAVIFLVTPDLRRCVPLHCHGLSS